MAYAWFTFDFYGALIDSIPSPDALAEKIVIEFADFVFAHQAELNWR